MVSSYYNKLSPEELRKKYPFLAMRNVCTDEIIDTEYTQFDRIPSGWRNSFGMKMVEELNDILEKANYVDGYRILDIKEKYGVLRLYSNSIPNDIYDEYAAWEDKYSELSAKTCIMCGKPATKLSRGWILPYCDDCASELKFTNFDELIL